MAFVEKRMKKSSLNWACMIGANGLVALPTGHGFRAGQRVFVCIKNEAIVLTPKPAGQITGKRRFSMRVRRVTTASRNVICHRPHFKKAVMLDAPHLQPHGEFVGLPERDQPTIQERYPLL